MPDAIRSDNGAPFASNAPGGVTKLSLWWERMGIRHERIEPGNPQQNGRHERFHLSLLRDRLNAGVAWDLRAQQRVFERYRTEFNQERPHEWHLPVKALYSHPERKMPEGKRFCRFKAQMTRR